MRKSTLFLALASLICAAGPLWAGVAADRLRCEYQKDPLGIDVVKPRLSWIVKSDERGEKQTAYQVLVASTPETLANEQGDLWDSGRVDSDQTLHVEYAGKQLTTQMRCYWKVRIWDKNGQPSPWSNPSLWTMGLLKPADWGGAKWITLGSPQQDVIAPHNGYHSEFATSADKVKWAAIDLGSERTIDAVELDPARPYDYSPDTPGFLFPVRFKIEAARKADFSDAKTVVDQTAADVPNPGVKALVYHFDPTEARHVRLTVTRLARREGTNFAFALAEMQVLADKKNLAVGAAVTALDSTDTGGWAKAKLTDGRLLPDRGDADASRRPATMVRKEFDVRGPIKRAVASVTGLGLYEMRINGRRVGDAMLTPDWTRYCKRIRYRTYDVTDLLREGRNAVGAQLGGGWWTGPMAFGLPMLNARFCFLMRLDIELADGSVHTIVTDPSWQTSDKGPIRRSGIYFGETYDATKEMPGWDEPGFAAADWSPAIALPYPDGSEKATLAAQCSEPICVAEELHPVKVTEPKPGVYVFDMGQNMVGWCRLKASAPAGTTITVRHAEILKNDGMIYTANLTNATQVAQYIWRGGEATVEPHFTYYGFRYVEITGLSERPRKDALVGRVFYSGPSCTGTFQCSNELVNRVMHCIEWVQRANMMSAPTDCPQRAERLGWMGDIQAFAQTAIFQKDMAGFFTKWVPDIRDSQADDGRYPDVAPHTGDPNQGFSGVPAWGDAGIVVPWRTYQNYADRRMLEEHFESATRWIEFVRRNNPNLLWQKNRGNDYNDWLNGDTLELKDPYPRGISVVPNEVFATAFFAHSTDIVAKMADVLGRKDDAAKYGKLFDDIKAAFRRAYVDSDGRVKGDTQAGYALALHFNLLDDATRPKATEHLIAAIRKYKDHPSTGIQATHRMMLELTRNGRHDEAWRLLNLRTVPSWGYMIEMGATTIWERWDGYVKGRGSQDEGMNSFNHWAFGAVGEWIWRELAGINPDDAQPAFKHFVIRPRPCDGLGWVKARYDSIRGPIVSEWKTTNGRFQLHVEIPANTTATVWVPAKDASTVTESDKPAAEAAGVKLLGLEEGAAVFAVESGRYSFESR
jgi:alpha-L-rhamnosidase